MNGQETSCSRVKAVESTSNCVEQKIGSSQRGIPSKLTSTRGFLLEKRESRMPFLFSFGLIHCHLLNGAFTRFPSGRLLWASASQSSAYGRLRDGDVGGCCVLTERIRLRLAGLMLLSSSDLSILEIATYIITQRREVKMATAVFIYSRLKANWGSTGIPAPASLAAVNCRAGDPSTR